MRFGIHRKIDDILLSREPLSTEIKENISFIELVVTDTSIPDFLFRDKDAFKMVEKYCEGFERTVHLPFYDLNLGSVDDNISNYSLNSLKKSLVLAERLGAEICVAHLGYNPRISKSATDKWLNRFIKRKREVEEFSLFRKITVAWENTYEKEISIFQKIINMDPDTKLCLDIGHCNCFASFSAVEFLKEFKAKTIHIHIHDNLGKEDSHLAPGNGNIDFKGIMKEVDHDTVVNAVFEIDTIKFQESVNEIKNIFMR